MFNSAAWKQFHSNFQRIHGDTPAHVNLAYMIGDASAYYNHPHFYVCWVLSPNYSSFNQYWFGQRTFKSAENARNYVQRYLRHIHQNDYPIAYHGEFADQSKRGWHFIHTDLNKRAPLYWIKRGKVK